jgi:hypothetical protein
VVYVASGTYGVYATPVAVNVPAGRNINVMFMGPCTVNDPFVVKQNRTIAYSEPGSLTINGNVNAAGTMNGFWKEFPLSQASYFTYPIFIMNELTNNARNCNISLCNIEFNWQAVVAEPAGAVDATASGAALFFGANYMGSYTVNLWMDRVFTRYRDGFTQNSRSWNHIFVQSGRLSEARNCIFGNQTVLKGIARAVDTVFDGNVTVTEANNSDSQYQQPMKGFYRCKFKSINGNSVVFTGPAGSFYCDKLTEKFSTGTNTVTFSGGAALTDRIGE